MELNEKEKKTLAAFPKNGEPIALTELAKAAFPSMGARSTTRGNSWVRNSLRKLIRQKSVKQLGRGLYAMLPTPSKKPTTTRRAQKTKPTAEVQATA